MSAHPAHASSLWEALVRSGRDHPAVGVTILDRRARIVERRTLPQLLEIARETGRRLARAGVTPRKPVFIALPTSWSWLESWLGAVSIGALPVAISPAAPLGAAENYLRRLTRAVERCGAEHIVVTPTLRRALAEIGRPGLEALTAPEVAALDPDPAGSPPEDPDSDAFLQLTSGTTGDSRVVRISHRAAVHNASAIGEAIAAPLGVSLEQTAGWRVVSWLPLYHDMGLVGSLLTGILQGVEVDLMPPQAFLGRPASWLSTLGAAGHAVTTAPNFAYQFCVEQVPEATADLELGGWHAALVGAETVRPETLEAFASRFSAAGFDSCAFRPCYGLAEAALAVTLDVVGAGLRTARSPAGAECACVGAPVADTEVWAAGPAGEPLADDRIGEIHVRGPGVFSGYRRDVEATRECLDDGVLRTGDLGFMKDGELYLTGRIKEILVVRGQNLMPDDIERLAETELGGGGVCRAAAFTVEEASRGEQIVLIAEAPTRDPAALGKVERAIREQVGRTLGLPLARLAFVAAGKLPRTTSGKVPRRRLREDYLEGRLAFLES